MHIQNHARLHKGWGELHYMFADWYRVHHLSVRDLLLSVLDLPQHPGAHQDTALHLVLKFGGSSRGARLCMFPHGIMFADIRARVQLDTKWAALAQARSYYDSAVLQLSSRGFYGVGLIVFSIKHHRDSIGDATYAAIRPIASSMASHVPYPYFDELFRYRLHMGEYVLLESTRVSNLVAVFGNKCRILGVQAFTPSLVDCKFPIF